MPLAVSACSNFLFAAKRLSSLPHPSHNSLSCSLGEESGAVAGNIHLAYKGGGTHPDEGVAGIRQVQAVDPRASLLITQPDVSIGIDEAQRGF
jgi:hypothetical protein